MERKVVVVTGASSGIGKATAMLFSKKGYDVVLAARSMDKLKAVEDEIRRKGGEVLAVKTDVAKEEDCKHLIEESIKAFGSIHVLINNAGVTMRALFNDTELDVIKNVMAINFWGAVYCTKFALPHLLKVKGSVVGVSSIAGYVGLPARTGYSASKFAMHGFLESLRTENLNNNLHVLVACPGFTASNIRNKALMADGSKQGESPRKEEKMMSAEQVAEYLLEGVQRRKQKMVLTMEGKLAVWMSARFPKFLQRLVFNKMRKEPDSPIES